MSGRLADKVAIVTGLIGGIGEGIVCVVAEKGATVVVSRRRSEGERQIAREITEAGLVYLASDEASRVVGCESSISGGLWT